MSSLYSYLKENLQDSVKHKNVKALDGFEDKLTTLEENGDNLGLIEYIVSLKQEILTLPISYKERPLTF